MSTTQPDGAAPHSGHDHAFGGLIGQEYEKLMMICPAAAEMSRQVGDFVSAWGELGGEPVRPLAIVEIGCGTGITTSALLHARSDANITAVDIEPTMLAQALSNLAEWLDSGRLRLVESDALSFLTGLPNESVDVVASGYAVHNFLNDYRAQVVKEVHRVLRPGGVFVNGDRYALDDTLEQTRVIQDELRQYFSVFSRLERPDLLEQWIVHLFGDESPDHVMRLEPALSLYRAVGFEPVRVHTRYQNNAVVSAEKPRA